MALTLKEFKSSELVNNPYCLLIGHPVEHSLSPHMHNAAAEYYDLDLKYLAVDVPMNDLSSLPPVFNKDPFVGANVTIPHKQHMASMVDEIDEAAEKIGAVNTIYRDNDRLWGGNTDAYGFAVPLEPYRDLLDGERAIIFGTGGASKAVVFALDKLGMQEIVLVSRNPGRRTKDEWPAPVKVVGYANWSAYGNEAMLIVNTTPLGMEPKVNKSPIREGEKGLLQDKICYDIVYKPRQTLFLNRAEEAGATVIGGLEMLIQQGSRSFEHWTGRPFPIDVIKKKLEDVI